MNGALISDVWCTDEESSGSGDSEAENDDKDNGADDDSDAERDNHVITKVTSKPRRAKSTRRSAPTTAPGSVMHIRRGLTAVTEQGVYCDSFTYLSLKLLFCKKALRTTHTHTHTIVLLLIQNYDFCISQGSVATRLRWGGIFINYSVSFFWLTV